MPEAANSATVGIDVVAVMDPVDKTSGNVAQMREGYDDQESSMQI